MDHNNNSNTNTKLSIPYALFRCIVFFFIIKIGLAVTGDGEGKANSLAASSNVFDTDKPISMGNNLVIGDDINSNGYSSAFMRISNNKAANVYTSSNANTTQGKYSNSNFYTTNQSSSNNSQKKVKTRSQTSSIKESPYISDFSSSSSSSFSSSSSSSFSSSSSSSSSFSSSSSSYSSQPQPSSLSSSSYFSGQNPSASTSYTPSAFSRGAIKMGAFDPFQKEQSSNIKSSNWSPINSNQLVIQNSRTMKSNPVPQAYQDPNIPYSQLAYTPAYPQVQYYDQNPRSYVPYPFYYSQQYPQSYTPSYVPERYPEPSSRVFLPVYVLENYRQPQREKVQFDYTSQHEKQSDKQIQQKLEASKKQQNPSSSSIEQLNLDQPDFAKKIRNIMLKQSQQSRYGSISKQHPSSQTSTQSPSTPSSTAPSTMPRIGLSSPFASSLPNLRNANGLDNTNVSMLRYNVNIKFGLSDNSNSNAVKDFIQENANNIFEQAAGNDNINNNSSSSSNNNSSSSNNNSSSNNSNISSIMHTHSHNQQIVNNDTSPNSTAANSTAHNSTTPPPPLQEYKIVEQQQSPPKFTSSELKTLSYSSFLQRYRPRKLMTKEEMVYREQIFNRNVLLMIQHNSNPESSYKMGINVFTDMEQQQFLQTYSNIDINEASKIQALANQFRSIEKPRQNNLQSTQNEVDWSCYGGRVRNQMNKCGASFVVPVLETIQITERARGKADLDLSVQEALLCRSSGSEGCQGYFQRTYDYLRNVGVGLTKYYPYSQSLSCETNILTHPTYQASKTFIKASNIIPYENCNLVLYQLRIQPLTVTILINKLQFYESGTFKIDKNSQPKQNQKVNGYHGVTLVGYDSQKGYLIKNYWGRDWGMRGYAYVDQNTGVCRFAIYPKYGQSASNCQNKFSI